MNKSHHGAWLRVPLCLFSAFVFSLLVSTAALAASLSPTPDSTAGLVQIAERVDYPLTVVGDRRTESAEHVIHRPGASFIKLHFKQFVLPPGVTIEIANPEGTEVYRYSRENRSPFTYSAAEGEDGRRSFSAMSISGDMAVVRVLGDRGNLDKRLHRVQVDYFMEGYPEDTIAELLNQPTPGTDTGLQRSGFFDDGGARPESTCGINERRDVQCWSNDYPTEFERSRPVNRLLIGGSSLCTGWRVGPTNRVFTNEHCVNTSSGVRNTEFWFNYQRQSCGGSLGNTVKVTGDQLLATNYTLDYTLLTVNNFDNIAGFGHFGLEVRDPVLGERIYIAQHGGGNPKELAIEDDQSSNGLCRIDDATANGRGSNTDTGYFCDTTGGSSGSPVIAASSNRAIALHHFGGCTNQGVKISQIWPQVAGFFNNQVPAGDNEAPGGNSAPNASFSYSCDGLSCSFDASASSDDGNIVSYNWDFGDGTSGSGVAPGHSYGADGNYNVVLTVTDDGDLSDNASDTVSVSEPVAGGLELSVTTRKRRGDRFADLIWSGAGTSQVDIFRDGSRIATTANDGSYTDQPNLPKRVKSADYQVCEAGSNTCSDTVTARF